MAGTAVQADGASSLLAVALAGEGDGTRSLQIPASLGVVLACVWGSKRTSRGADGTTGKSKQRQPPTQFCPACLLVCLFASSSSYSSSSLSPLTFFCWLRAEVGAWQPNFSQTGDYHGADFLRGSFDWCHAGASVTSVSHRPCNKVVTLAVN